ncbi:MAG TPA: DUF6049 family protein [Trebonia sp.]
MRTVVRTLIAALLIAAPLLAALEAPASARTGNPFSGTDQAASHSLSISIDSVGPRQWAQPGEQITVHGTVTNNTGSPVSGLQVAIQTESTAVFSDRSSMETYTAGGAVSSLYLAITPVGTPYTLPGTLHSGTTRSWSVSFPASEAGYTQFGVYPLAAVLYNSALAPIRTDRTLLPYWPGSGANPMRAAWLWPLVDQPKQGPCPQTLADNTLATSLAPSGRLGGLLSTGLKWAGQAKLTWAVDPALLSDAQTMATPYKVGGNAGCTGTTGEPASKAAQTWLSTLKTDAAGEPMFVTPYADADVSALANAGMTANVQSAYTLGDQVAHESLERPFGQNGGGTGDGGAPSAAWLAGGTTDNGVLTTLAKTGGINTVVFGTDAYPSATSAVGSTTTGAGTSMRVLLADSQLMSLLGTSNGQSSAGAQFATEQDFLAETAMIVAELPFGKDRSVVIAPPRRWSPSAAEADTLLSESVNAPWLRPTQLKDLASAPGDPQKLPSGQRDSAELGNSYMNLVRFVGGSLRTYQDLLAQPDSGTTQSLREALTATTSTAWRGSGNGAGTATLLNLSNFVRDAEQKVEIIGGKKWLLAGASGDVAVSVQNGMSQPVQVRVQVSDPDVSQLSIGKFGDLITIAAGGTGTVKVPVHSSGIETTTMQLQLVTRNGSPLSTPSQPLTVQVTRYGRALIILIAAALGVVVLASGARWVRQWRSGTRAGSGGTG